MDPALSIKRRIGSSKRMSKLSGGGSSGASEELVYHYALRVAYLAYLTQPKAPAPSSITLADHVHKRLSLVSGGAGTGSGKSHEILIESISSGFSQLHEMFKDDKKGNKSQNIPRELLKLLQNRLAAIVQGKDPNPIFTDRYLRTDLTLFYNALQQPGFRTQFKSGNNKIEDLVLIYLKTAQFELQKVTFPPPLTWQDKLTEHVSIFVGILKECLLDKECGNYPPDLLTRLDAYQTRFSAPSAPVSSSTGLNTDEMLMVQAVASIFGLPMIQVQKDINKIMGQCTEQAALEDLRTCINHVNRGSPFPARREDFESEDAYTNWKSTELKTLADIMKTMIQFNSSLSLKQSSEVMPSLLSKEKASANSRVNPRNSASPSTRYQQLPPQPDPSQQGVYNQLPPYAQQQQSQFRPPNAGNYPSPTPSPISPSGQLPSGPYQGQQYQQVPGAQPVIYPQQTGQFGQPGIYPPPGAVQYQPGQYPPQTGPYQAVSPHPSGQITQTQPPPQSPEIAQGDYQTESNSFYGAFTFIPPNPKVYYKILLNKCVDYEISIRTNDDVSAKILSKSTQNLLSDCALRWRVPPGYRSLVYLDSVRSKFSDNHPLIELEHVKEGMHSLKESMKKFEVSTWSLSDRRELISVFSALHDALLRFLDDGLQHLYKIKPESFEPALFLLQNIYDTELFRQTFPDISKSYDQLRESVKAVAVAEWKKQRDNVFAQPGENELVPLVTLSQWIQDQIEKLSKKYPQPIMGQIDVLQLVIEQQVPLFTLDMENLAADILNRVKAGDENGIPVEQIFDLYREVREIKRLYESHCAGVKFNFSLEGWFRPHVKKWLEMTDSKTAEWVQSAISVDEFKPVSSTDLHSSSVVDLFTSFNQTIEFLKRLEWPDEYQYARFMTSLANTISKALEQYCGRMEDLFMRDLFSDEERNQVVQKQSAWYVRAKTAIASEDKIFPFDFKPELCFKLNNIQAGREQLDKLSRFMDVDYLADIITRCGPPVPEKVQKTRFLFTIKIVLAENLVPLDSNGYSDPYCILTDETGHRLAQTRVIYETLNPRWDEAFDITIETGDKMRWVAATVWDRDQIGADDVCGRAYFRLDPDYFNDFSPHDVWLDLEKQGRLLLRISMEGERDDIQFYFGKAFRTLKRTENDMTRNIVDRMSPFLRQCMSRDVINKLVKPTSTLSLGLGGLFDKKREPLTEVEVEKAIDPLFDYFDTNLRTLNMNLNASVTEMVMTKVWKEIESVLEDLLVPPLSDRPSDMKPLNESEVDVVYKWLKFLKNYLNAEGNGVSNELLENVKYHDLMTIRYRYDMPTDELMQEYLHLLTQSSLTPKKESKSVMGQYSLGTIKKRKTEKRKKKQASSDNGEIILRILRMRPGTKNFLKQQTEERMRRSQASGPSNPMTGEGEAQAK